MNSSTIPDSTATLLLNRVAELYSKNLQDEALPKRFLSEHGLTNPALWEQFRLGYCNGTLEHLLPKDETMAGLAALGILDVTGHEFFAGGLVCPLLSDQGQVTGFVALPVDSTGELRWLPREAGFVWNLPALKAATEIYLVDSVLDGLSLAASGLTNVIAANQPNTTNLWAIVRRQGIQNVTLVGGKRRGVPLPACAAGISVATVALPDCSSVHEYLLRCGPQDLSRYIQTHGKSGDILQVAEPLPDGFVLRRKNRRYDVRGLERSPRFLKATVRLEFSGRTHVDTINLYGAKVRRRFVHEVANFCNEAPEVIEPDIERLLLVAEARAAQLQSNLAKSDSVVALTEAERVSAEALARSPDLIDQILADFDRCGLVGERTNKLLCYLAITSRKLPEPLSILILASSGAGKSALQDAAAAFCPPEDLIKLTSLSGKALYYGERSSLKHKVLAVEEGDGLGAGSYALRSLMSAGELVAATTVRNPADGRLSRISNRVEGPTAVFLTTTNPNLDPETKSRFMVTSVDESREQTQAVLAWQRRLHGPEGLGLASVREAILRRHWALQRLLEPVAIVNPLAEQLSFADDGLASRRDQPKFFRLIAAVAFLRQRQKTVKYADSPSPCAYVEVDDEDVRLANQISAGLFGHTLGELSRPGFELLQLVVRMRKAAGVSLAAFRFGRRDIREFGRWSQVRVHRYLQELLEMEYVARVSHEGCHLYRLRWDGQGHGGEGFDLTLPPSEQNTISPVSGTFHPANVA